MINHFPSHRSGFCRFSITVCWIYEFKIQFSGTKEGMKTNNSKTKLNHSRIQPIYGPWNHIKRKKRKKCKCTIKMLILPSGNQKCQSIVCVFCCYWCCCNILIRVNPHVTRPINGHKGFFSDWLCLFCFLSLDKFKKYVSLSSLHSIVITCCVFNINIIWLCRLISTA